MAFTFSSPVVCIKSGKHNWKLPYAYARANETCAEVSHFMSFPEENFEDAVSWKHSSIQTWNLPPANDLTNWTHLKQKKIIIKMRTQ